MKDKETQDEAVTKRPWTKGPWEVVTINDDGFDDGTYVMMGTRIYNPGNYRCAHEWKCESVNEPEALANARLMAAAPQLYEALDNLMCLAEDAMRAANRDGAEYDIDNELAEARAALRAANPDAFKEEFDD